MAKGKHKPRQTQAQKRAALVHDITIQHVETQISRALYLDARRNFQADKDKLSGLLDQLKVL